MNKTATTATLNGQRITNANAAELVTGAHPKASVDKYTASRTAPTMFWINAGDGHTNLGEGKTAAQAWKNAALKIATKQEGK